MPARSVGVWPTAVQAVSDGHDTALRRAEAGSVGFGVVCFDQDLPLECSTQVRLVLGVERLPTAVQFERAGQDTPPRRPGDCGAPRVTIDR